MLRVRAVAVREIVRELQRDLAGGPLARVVDANDEEHGTAVLRPLYVAGDLDAVDRAAFVRRLGERDRLHVAGIGVGERLQLGLVVDELAVGRPVAARQVRRASQPPRVGGIGRPALVVALRKIRDLGREVEPGLPERRAVGGRIEDDVGGPLANVVRDVQAKPLEPVQVALVAELDVHERRSAELRRRGDIDQLHRDARIPRPAAMAAALDCQALPALDPRLRELTRTEGLRGRQKALRGLVEDRQVPVGPAPARHADVQVSAHRGAIGLSVDSPLARAQQVRSARARDRRGVGQPLLDRRQDARRGRGGGRREGERQQREQEGGESQGQPP